MAAISETKRRRTFNFYFIYRFCEALISEKVLANVSHHSTNTSISEPKRRSASNVDSIGAYIGFVGRIFQESIVEYIMPLYPQFWRRFNKKWRPLFKVIRVICENMRQRIGTLVST